MKFKLYDSTFLYWWAPTGRWGFVELDQEDASGAAVVAELCKETCEQSQLKRLWTQQHQAECLFTEVGNQPCTCPATPDCPCASMEPDQYQKALDEMPPGGYTDCCGRF